MPKQIGKYTIIKKIGEGGWSEVFKGIDPVLKRFVAVKTISKSCDADGKLRERFYREACSVAQLNHPNIITVFELGEEGGKIFMAMEFLEGVDLKEIMKNAKPLLLDTSLNYMEQLSDGLGYAHSKGIVHRDLKPGNIRILPTDQVKIMDFGLARLTSLDITGSGEIMGTPNYMSPEQVQGQSTDCAADIFPLGAILYEMLTHRKPFKADSIHATMFKVVHGAYEPLSPQVPDIPDALVQLIDKALSKSPAERYQDGYDFLEALRPIRRDLDKKSLFSSGSEEIIPRAGDKPSASVSPQLEITPELLDRQMAHLRRKGYRSVSLQEALVGEGRRSLPARPIVISFDDAGLTAVR